MVHDKAMKKLRKWSREWFAHNREARTRYDELYRRRTVPLPESSWYKCPTCNGTGSYEMPGDAHRSAGIVPCNHCSGGIRKTRYATIDKTTDEALAKRESGFIDE